MEQKRKNTNDRQPAPAPAPEQARMLATEKARFQKFQEEEAQRRKNAKLLKNAGKEHSGKQSGSKKRRMTTRAMAMESQKIDPSPSDDFPNVDLDEDESDRLRISETPVPPDQNPENDDGVGGGTETGQTAEGTGTDQKKQAIEDEGDQEIDVTSVEPTKSCGQRCEWRVRCMILENQLQLQVSQLIQAEDKVVKLEKDNETLMMAIRNLETDVKKTADQQQTDPMEIVGNQSTNNKGADHSYAMDAIGMKTPEAMVSSLEAQDQPLDLSSGADSEPLNRPGLIMSPKNQSAEMANVSGLRSFAATTPPASQEGGVRGVPYPALIHPPDFSYPPPPFQPVARPGFAYSLPFYPAEQPPVFNRAKRNPLLPTPVTTQKRKGPSRWHYNSRSK